MTDTAKQNKSAWEYRAYEFWNMKYGNPREKAAKLLRDPLASFHLHRNDFENVRGQKVANVCGSNGRMAVPLAIMGGDVTVFDISWENRLYAMELAQAANVPLEYVVGDFCEVELDTYGGAFDIAYAEGGILHYFHALDVFFDALHGILKTGGRLILSDFHPFRKLIAETGNAAQTGGDYFDNRIHSGAVAYKDFFPESEHSGFIDCSLRFYTISELINAVIRAGFTLNRFVEHPHWEENKKPALFTIYATK